MVERPDSQTEIRKLDNGRVETTIYGDEFETEEANVLNHEGIELAKIDDLNGAREKLLEALTIEPNNPTILNNLGLVEKSTSAFPKAASYFQKSISVSDSTYLNASINLGLTYYEMKQYDNCIDISKKVLLKTDDEFMMGGAYLHITMAYIKLKDCQKARESLASTITYLKNIKSVQEQLSRYEVEIEDLCSTE